MLAELAHIIEKAERQIFARVNPHLKELSLKDFRHNHPQERGRVVDTIEAVWGQVMQYAALSTMLNDSDLDQAITLLQSAQVDGYDLFILRAAQQAKIAHIISDDSDMATVQDMVLFTANRCTIDSAREQKRLLVR